MRGELLWRGNREYLMPFVELVRSRIIRVDKRGSDRGMTYSMLV
jgi:hypothetical protein